MSITLKGLDLDHHSRSCSDLYHHICFVWRTFMAQMRWKRRQWKRNKHTLNGYQKLQNIQDSQLKTCLLTNDVSLGRISYILFKNCAFAVQLCMLTCANSRYNNHSFQDATLFFQALSILKRCYIYIYSFVKIGDLIC